MTPAKSFPVAKKHHWFRTTVAAICGDLALTLVLLSVLVVWANNTLTNTAAYTAAVGPIVSQSAVQEYVAQQLSQQLLKSAPTQQLEQTLLSPQQITGKTPAQIQALLSPVIEQNITQVVSSPAFVAAWKQTNQTDHQSFVQQLNANDSNVTINLAPIATAAIAQLKLTKLAPVASQLNISPSAAVINLKGSAVTKVHTAYKILREAAIGVVILTLVLFGLCIWISVHHIKTLRRMVIGTGMVALIVAGLIKLPALVFLHPGEPAQKQAVAAIVETLLHGLWLACLVSGVVLIAIGVGSKVYEVRRAVKQ